MDTLSCLGWYIENKSRKFFYFKICNIFEFTSKDDVKTKTFFNNLLFEKCDKSITFSNFLVHPTINPLNDINKQFNISQLSCVYSYKYSVERAC